MSANGKVDEVARARVYNHHPKQLLFGKYVSLFMDVLI